MNVLVVGNVINDIYLKLDERQNELEEDADEIFWLNLGFNGETHNFIKRTSILSGVNVALEVLQNFGLSAKTASGSNVAQDYRYILCYNHDVSYFTPKNHAKTVWQMPDEVVDWIFIDRSAHLTAKLVQDIETFLSMSKHTQMAFYETSENKEIGRTLLKQADLVFTEEKIKTYSDKQHICRIHKNRISLDGQTELWHISRKELMTHLTAHSILATSILASIIQDRDIKQTLLLAKANIENASLDATLSLQKLEELAEELQEQKNNLKMTASLAKNGGEDLQKYIKTIEMPKKISEFAQKVWQYHELGFRFVKWIEHIEDEQGYKKLSERIMTCQDAGLVPIVKIDFCLQNYDKFLEQLQESLEAQFADLDGYILERII